MSTLLDRIFGSKQEATASLAKDRLKIVLAHERVNAAYPFMEDLKRDIVEVVKKYISVKDINIKTEKSDNLDVLEVEVKLDEKK